jgi:formylmethanofuran dehydrogenase subunit A
MFSHPRYVIKAGDVVLEDGDIREAPQGKEFLIRPAMDPATNDFMRPLFEDCYTMKFEHYPVELERIEHPDLRDCRPQSPS